MLVTDEMVRRALNVLANKVGGCPGLTLSDVCDDTQCGCADETRAALEAVAPAIRAAALEEAARLCDDDADGRYRALRMLPMIPVVATYAEAHARAAASRENAAAIRALNAPRDGS